MSVPDLRGARIGIVLGSGAHPFAARVADARPKPFRALGLPAPTVEGHAGRLILGRVADVPVAVLAGRLHVYEGHSLARVAAPVRQLARAGVRAVILTNAAGGVRRTLRPGDLMLVSDHINGFGGDPLAGRAGGGKGRRFTDMTGAYDPELRRAARAAARGAGIRLREGVYAGVPGPSFETAAEIRMWRSLGADAIGMSTVPETIALRGEGVRVLAISLIANMAAGLSAASLGHGQVLATARRASRTLGDLLEAIVPRIDRLIRA